MGAISTQASYHQSGRPHVLIAGAGVAGLEALLALRAVAGDRVDITIVAPELKFLNPSMSVDQPFKPKRARGIRLESLAAEFDARWIRAKLDRIDHGRHEAVARDGRRLPYDKLVVALGAHPAQWLSRSLIDRGRSHVLTYSGARDNPDFAQLLDRVRDGRVNKLVFVKPAGATWPLPLYDLALMTVADCAVHGRSQVELSLVTPEQEPLGIFGNDASTTVRRLLEERGVTLYTASYAEPVRPGWLEVTPGDRVIELDRVVTEPRLAGPGMRGLPCDRDGFVHIDAHGRVPDLDGLFAAGDATNFPVKHGALAAQLADAVAEAITASVGVDIDPQPFRPVLRGVLLTGGLPRYLRSDISGVVGEDSTISDGALWWPPNKLAARYLGPYLSSQVGAAPDVMPQDASGTPVHTALHPGGLTDQLLLADLSGTRSTDDRPNDPLAGA
jgi:sulfide:quinone oxidoreductase